MNQKLLSFALEKAKKYLSKSKGSHDIDHTLRVLNIAKHLAKKENADLDVVMVAALLHDISRPVQAASKGKICHAEHGSLVAKKLLEKNSKKLNLSQNKIDSIAECISTHRFRGNNYPKTLEAKILFDADKLDSIGAIGVGRVFLFAGEIGAKLHNDPETRKNIHLTKNHSVEDTAYREFALKLYKIKDKLYTKEGKRIAKERHEFMEEFFERLNKETEGEI
ncbi:MAG: HD domain-containing protein [archaeon]|jgi:uncharacterized protein